MERAKWEKKRRGILQRKWEEVVMQDIRDEQQLIKKLKAWNSQTDSMQKANWEKKEKKPLKKRQ